MLTLAGCQIPAKLLSHSPFSAIQEEKKRWKKWVKIKLGSLLTSYHHGQNRLGLEKIQSFTNWSNMVPSSGLQFFKNCSSMGPIHWVQSFRKSLGARGLQHGFLFRHGPPLAVGEQPVSPQYSTWTARESLLWHVEHLHPLLFHWLCCVQGWFSLIFFLTFFTAASQQFFVPF